MSQPEDSFLTHLFELRDRLIRALLAVAIVFICLFPWSKELYTLLAQPLLDTLRGLDRLSQRIHYRLKALGGEVDLNEPGAVAYRMRDTPAKIGRMVKATFKG